MKIRKHRNLLLMFSLYAAGILAAYAYAADSARSKSRSDAYGSAPASEVQHQRTARRETVHVGAVKERPKFDPIQVNGEFFKGWRKPAFALLITGRQDGYLEPCGCAGIDQQKGGLNRRHALVKQLEADGWPLAAMDVGGLVRRFGTQAEIQFSNSARALKLIGYDAVGFGAEDLRLSATAVGAAAAEQELFVSANVNVLGLTPTFRIVEVGGRKIGITSIIGPDYQKQVNNSEVEFTPAAEALAKVMPELRNCQLKVLLSYASEDVSKQLAKQFPQFDIVVTAGGADEPPPQAEKIKGSKALLVQVGHKGMYAIVLGFYDKPRRTVRYQRVALDSRFPNTPEMQQVMAEYQQHLQAVGWSGLGLQPVKHPRTTDADPNTGRFVGAASCKECHEREYDIWVKTPHAHATETLVNLKPQRQYDAECVSCHTTGWHPQEFFPYVSGYDSMEKTPHLAGNSCENCHGPGAAHVAAEQAGEEGPQLEALRKAMHLSLEVAEKESCIKCHDIDNSPEFKFETYWPKVKH